MNKYIVTSCGEVVGRDGPLYKREDKYGYLYVRLSIDGNSKHRTIHRLVAETFLPNKQNLPQINHKDGNKKNNKVSNLEWCTQKHNMQHAIKTGLWKPYDRTLPWNRQAIVDSNKRRKHCGI